MDNDTPHPLKVFAYAFGAVIALAAFFGFAMGPMLLFIALSEHSAWWILAAFVIGFAWVIATFWATIAWFDRRGWTKYLPSLSARGRD